MTRDDVNAGVQGKGAWRGASRTREESERDSSFCLRGDDGGGGGSGGGGGGDSDTVHEE